jgi:type I restriction-modification system DNA methylase subunit
MPAQRKASPESSTATIGFEAKLWLAADKLRNNMDAAEYKHVVLGLIFRSQVEQDAPQRASRGQRVKYTSDSFEKNRTCQNRHGYAF